jgi:predicted nucleic acid-binding protein
MRILVDTSVWAEFFRSRPAIPRQAVTTLRALIEDDRVVTLLPIEAEVLSGRIAGTKESEVRRAFAAIEHIDLDWSARTTWDGIVDLARAAQAADLPMAGIVDRMVVLAAETRSVRLWTLDRRLARLATARGLAMFGGAGAV